MIAVDVKCFICGGFFCEQTPECLPVKEEPKIEVEAKVEEKPVKKPAKKTTKKAAKKIKTVADNLKNQKTIGWFQGRMEFGPRALGCRSILADPRSETLVRTK